MAQPRYHLWVPSARAPLFGGFQEPEGDQQWTHWKRHTITEVQEQPQQRALQMLGAGEVTEQEWKQSGGFLRWAP